MKKLLVFIMALAVYGPAPTFGQQRDTLRANNLFGDLKARHIGPALMSGRINDLEVHPENQRILYVASAGGGFWKPMDAATP